VYPIQNKSSLPHYWFPHISFTKTEPPQLGFQLLAQIHPLPAHNSIFTSQLLNPGVPHPKWILASQIHCPLQFVHENQATAAWFSFFPEVVEADGDDGVLDESMIDVESGSSSGDEGDSLEDDGVVTIISSDPLAAARATAILMFILYLLLDLY
jgi:hypothetical protein